MVSSWRLALILLVSAVAISSVGCGRGDMPDLGRVKGTVTLEGKPLGGVVVIFVPENGRPSMANADPSGNYDLNYTDEVKGAKVGNCTVSVQWPDGEAGTAKIPAKYNVKTELKKEVKSGSNTIDLALESK
jgi:hypothetical protein